MLKKVNTIVIRRGKVPLQWVKGHSKVLGNELADRAADRGRTALLPTGGRYTDSGMPRVDITRLTATGMPTVDNEDLAHLQHFISTAAFATFDPIARKARKPWISQAALTLIDRAALARSWGHTAQEETIQKLIKKSARKDKARHIKKAMAEAAADKTGKLFDNNIKTLKTGFSSNKLCLHKGDTPQPLHCKAAIFAEHL